MAISLTTAGVADARDFDDLSTTARTTGSAPTRDATVKAWLGE
jgi:hypothetical protein